TGPGLRVEVLLFDARGDLFETALARKHCFGLALLPAGIAGVEGLLVGAVLEDRGRSLEAARENIERVILALSEVEGVERLTAHLGVEVEAAIAQAAILQDLDEGQRHLAGIVGELVGVPATLQIVAVGIDAAQDTQ